MRNLDFSILQEIRRPAIPNAGPVYNSALAEALGCPDL
jgi:hypothetical protein